MNDYEELKKDGFDGFAHHYLQQCDETLSILTKSDYTTDIRIYSKLVELDSKLGTSASAQLQCCLNFTTRSDFIKVLFLLRIHGLKSIEI